MHKAEKYLRVTATTRHTLDVFHRTEDHLHNLKLIWREVVDFWVFISPTILHLKFAACSRTSTHDIAQAIDPTGYRLNLNCNLKSNRIAILVFFAK